MPGPSSLAYALALLHMHAPIHFNPPVADTRSCYTCRYFQGRFNGEVLLCDDPRFPAHCPSLPKQGCAFWQREPGSDDELGEPMAARHTADDMRGSGAVHLERSTR